MNAKDERKPTDSPDQFYYKTRKKALGPFKKDLWALPDATKAALAQAYDKTFGFLFDQLQGGEHRGHRRQDGEAAAAAPSRAHGRDRRG